MKERGKNFYDVWGNTLKQNLENCFPNIRTKIVGSRAKGTFERSSDLDFQMCFEGGQTTNEQIYPKVVSCLKEKLIDKVIAGERVLDIREGGSGNVVNVFPEGGGKISFALEPCSEFE